MRTLLYPLLSGISLSLLLLASCDGRTQDRRAERGATYVSDPDHLFFMNTRSRDYRSVTPEEGTDVFYHDDLDGSPSLLIRNNWLQDRAELVLDGRVVTTEEARRLRNAVGSQRDSLDLSTDTEREAVAEVIADYLRLVGG
ncbi:hypothetical protein CLV84_2391 [Neolewinella xylanilytica]|uniref:Uncharacterized protein n=1 Tax=Neolewinella xylanilytica TaxID=1514080 RepID=A0A2S6I2S8_9BACT|nr:hypothetical protein [Neolewinella xylanilytica]PPK85492.1 hypothetical protein CLV84_2391 [Neolewinella xylanilytica]